MAQKTISVEFKGGEELRRNIEKYGRDALQALAAELYREAEATMTESKLEVPVDTGALRASGTVALPVVAADSVVVEMGYGGPAVDYAVFVHEDLQAFHPVGHAKYLENPITRRASTFEERVGNGVKRRLGG